jgi:hypothetical protein
LVVGSILGGNIYFIVIIMVMTVRVFGVLGLFRFHRTIVRVQSPGIRED